MTVHGFFEKKARNQSVGLSSDTGGGVQNVYMAAIVKQDDHGGGGGGGLSETFARIAIDLDHGATADAGGAGTAAGESTAAAPQILSIADLDRHLGTLSQAIFQALGSRQLEATYQRCLALDLTQAGTTVEVEVEMELTYKGHKVGTRRADLVVRTADGGVAVLELKASTNSLHAGQLKQLQYYMYHLNASTGYLINFPHDDGFPSVAGANESGEFVQFRQVALSPVTAVTAVALSDVALRGQNESGRVEVRKVVMEKLRGHAAATAAATTPRLPVPASAWGVTKEGKPCKTCIKQQRFCSQHANQAASR